ncbi:MAG TPA: GH116 family glycosyl-hydrolase, partial [Bryobacteraceae bacterium]
MSDRPQKPGRRAFLRQAALAAAAPAAASQSAPASSPAKSAPGPSEYPRVYTGRKLAMLAFPFGGVGAGSISLGGRGQLRDWEIFNRADKGASFAYAFPAIWARSGTGKPVARVLEARMLPPYEGQNGLGTRNAPGLSRIASAAFTGEYPLARIDFRDARLPVHVALEAFSPFIPLDAEDSGLPLAFLRYRVSNNGKEAAQVSIAWSIENPCGATDGRTNEVHTGGGLHGLVMNNPALDAKDPLHGEFAFAALTSGDPKITTLRGWQRSRWWNSPMLFWDDFTADGELGPKPADRNAVGSLCLARTIGAGAHADFTFLLSWWFPNRTPRRCGWTAPKGDEDTVIGNHYCQRFPGAWQAAEYGAQNLQRLEKYTRMFAASLRASTLPAPVREAASANLSTLATTTCFRTADGEFHGFEGVNDHSGCCYGNCTHVWNYETATSSLFPTLARSLRGAAFGYSLDDAGAIHFRQMLPDGKARSGFAAADGQMGQIVKVYHDWRLTGDSEWLRAIWPRVKKALEFAWVPDGWDADRDGVLEGVQHNTYDVEFYGPNPQCGIWYLAALRAGEEMSRETGDTASAAEYRRLFDNGSQWIDANLFNGEYYIQKIRGRRRDQIANSLMSTMGSENTEQPEYQVGEGCLVDQLVGQYLASIAGLGPLLDPGHVRKTLESIFRYNRKKDMSTHDTVQRTFALNDESALVICDYGKAPRPHIPFPYYAEVMTGFEYSAAVAMIEASMVEQGVECIAEIRRRYDGERRNPWDEAECGHHYARAMASWSGILALSGFHYHGA